MTALTVAERIEQAELAHVEGRIIQHSWRRSNGKEYVCALAAFGPDINGAEDCPAELMPQWMAQLVPFIDDSIAAEDVPWFMGELLARAKRWAILDDAAWERIHTGFMIRSMQLAIEEAGKVQPDPKPEYWQQVVDALNQVERALRGEGDLKQAEAAARAAARAAAYRNSADLLFKLIDAELAAVVG